MPKRKNGGGEYKKVKGSNGKSSPKRSTVSQPSQTMVMPDMPMAPSFLPVQKSIERMPDIMESPMPYAPRILEESKPLQPRQTFIQRAPDVSSNMPFRNTDIERLKELGKRFGASGD